MRRRRLIASLIGMAVGGFGERVGAGPEPKAGNRTLTFEHYGWTYNRGDEAVIYTDLEIGALRVGEVLEIEGFIKPMGVTRVNPDGYGSYFVKAVSDAS